MPNLSTTDSRILNGISLVSLIGRMVITLMVIVFWQLGGFRIDELRTLTFILGPITMILIAGFIRFIIQYPYAIAQSKLSPIYAIATRLFALIGHCIIIGAISLCALNPSLISFSALSWVLFLTELAFAIYIATILGNLFGRFPLS